MIAPPKVISAYTEYLCQDCGQPNDGLGVVMFDDGKKTAVISESCTRCGLRHDLVMDSLPVFHVVSKAGGIHLG
jgi:DNA-directed RNA polymerase subunit RPC12/RpoP